MTEARDFWRDKLVAGGSTRIPRWAREPVPGVGLHEVVVSDDELAALRLLADEAGVTLGTLLLAAHAKVLTALSGESTVTTGYVAPDGGPPVPCRLSTASDSWLKLVVGTGRLEWEMPGHRRFPVDELRQELGLTEPSFETVFDLTGDDGELSGEDVVLGVGFAERDGQFVLLVRYRTDVLDGDAARRIAGYHLTALTLMAADPSAEHGLQSLLSAEELNFQLFELAGPRRELPERRVHQLFEQQVAAHPDAVAAVHGDLSVTYGDLNSRANRLARALLARGLRREDVVAVVSERNLDWLTAVLAIFKAGGAYLPVEPHFPADRIATMLSRSECALVVTERESTTNLDEALDSLPGIRTLFVSEAFEESHADDDPGVEVAPDQLAYIYFTSGSTGEPKGAMCEHAGFLNHVFAKIDDLEIDERTVVAQTAPQCFDISLWQLVSALVVGGRTLLVGQEAILDVQRFLDTIVDGQAAVIQVVPSYLEAVVSYLERHPRELPELRCVSVTGEALTKELAERWFAVQPEISLVNAYGLTETSDDTNHEVMRRAPDGDRISLGPAVNNVNVYVVDEHLSPVPLAAQGEIVFSGVCVGRGYVNDPDRTRLAFTTDPHRKGERLYRGGDFGRWRPDGKLEFLGRRDSQVKVSGFRIELGEIESALSGVPGVHQSAVVVAERPDGSKHLVAFYSGPQLREVDVVRARLAEILPPYMVPSTVHWRERLALTPNGKVDRKMLTATAEQLDAVRRTDDAPSTPSERRLAGAWAKVLGAPEHQIGREDHFFDRGGTSLAAVKLAISLDSAVSLQDVIRHPVLADLARVLDDPPERLQVAA